MLSVNVQGYSPACSPTVGGADLLLVGDAADFDFTEGAPDSNGNPTGYSAIARRSGATTSGGAYLYEIKSLQDSIMVEISQANSDFSSSEYQYVVGAKLAKMSQAMTNFNKKMDAASVCGQLVFVWRNNDGSIFVAGEKFVNGVQVIRFRFRQDGSKIGNGKKFSDFNGQDLSFKASYLRAPYEFTGGIGSITGMMP